MAIVARPDERPTIRDEAAQCLLDGQMIVAAGVDSVGLGPASHIAENCGPLATHNLVLKVCGKFPTHRNSFYTDDLSVSKGRTPNALTLKLGERVRKLRHRQKWTQAELEAHLGVDRGHISEIENGKRMIRLETLQTIAKGFDMTMSALLKGL